MVMTGPQLGTLALTNQSQPQAAHRTHLGGQGHRLHTAVWLLKHAAGCRPRVKLLPAHAASEATAATLAVQTCHMNVPWRCLKLGQARSRPPRTCAVAVAFVLVPAAAVLRSRARCCRRIAERTTAPRAAKHFAAPILTQPTAWPCSSCLSPLRRLRTVWEYWDLEVGTLTWVETHETQLVHRPGPIMRG